MVTQESRNAGVDPKKRPIQPELLGPLTNGVDAPIPVRAGSSGKPYDDDDPYADVPCTD